MARHPKQADYERTARNRAGVRFQAIALGWTELDTLSVYLTGGGEIIVIDKELNRYAATAEAEQLTAPVVSVQASPVEPLLITAAEFGPRWERGRTKVGANIAGLDLATLDRAAALALFTQMAQISLRGVEVLTEHSGPDWREAIGLSSDES